MKDRIDILNELSDIRHGFKMSHDPRDHHLPPLALGLSTCASLIHVGAIMTAVLVDIRDVLVDIEKHTGRSDR